MSDDLAAIGRAIAESGRHKPPAVVETNGHVPELSEPPLDVDDHHATEWTLNERRDQSTKTSEAIVDCAAVEGMPRLYRATDLKSAAQPRWLAKHRLQRAAINLLIGDEGIGKSLLWVLIVAAVTTGKALRAFGIAAREPAHVILVCTEDDWQTTVRPRLEVANADLSKVLVICVEDDGSGAPLFPRDLVLVLDADPKPALVVVDCWLDTVPGGLSVRDPQQARQALHPWKDVATKTDAAVLLLAHTNRVASPNARDRYGATAVLRQKVRLTLFAQSDDDGRLVVGPEKSNNAAAPPASLFTISPVLHFQPTVDSDGTVPLLVYAGDSDRTAREHIADAYETDHGEDRQERTGAAKWLQEYIEFNGPNVLSAEVKREAGKAGFSERTLQRARQDLRVVYGWVGNPPKTTWSLPLPANDAAETVATDDTPTAGGAPSPVSRGIPGTAGTAAGQDAMPRCATGIPLAQGSDQRKRDAVPAVPTTNGHRVLDDGRIDCPDCGPVIVCKHTSRPPPATKSNSR